MHELSVTRSILDIVLEASGGARVRRVELRVGSLTGVVESHLRHYFSLLAEQTIAAGATLSVELCHAQARCLGCGCDGPVEIPLPAACGCCGGSLRFSGGAELEVVKIEVDDGETDPDQDSQDQRSGGAGGAREVGLPRPCLDQCDG